MNASNALTYVLHTRNYRETSQLVDVFSREFGRLRVVARGARRKSGKGRLHVFTPMLASWQGRGELKSLTGAEVSGKANFLLGERLYIGLYLNELLIRLLPEYVPHEVLFDRYAELVTHLSSIKDLEPSLRGFEFFLLEALGYGIDLTTEVNSGRGIMTDEHYHFVNDEGFVRFDGLSSREKKGSFEGLDLLAMAADDYSNIATRRSAKRLLRGVLNHYLGGRPLLSRQLFRQMSSPVRQGEA